MEPLAHNAEWHVYITRNGGKLVTCYKGCDIHVSGISYYVNGRWIGTSMRSAKAYINSNK